MKRTRDQRGVALLTAVLIVAIVAALSIYLAWDRTLAFRRTQDLVDQDRARQLCLGAEAWAAHTLADTVHRPDIDLGQSWAHPMPVTRIGGGEVGGRIEDLQGRFNLNNLLAQGQVVGTSRQRFRRLLSRYRIDPARVDAVLDWIDRNDVPRGTDGAEDGTYMGAQPPYRAANRAFLSASSLRLVHGFDTKALAELSPSLAALPAGTAINVNTAPAPVLRALGLGPDVVKALVQHRRRHPFVTLSALRAWLPVEAQSLDAARLGVKSRYFRMHAQARVGQVRESLYSVIQVENAGRVRVLMRSWNARP
jgi:general secretion pathway protein K